MSVPMALFDFVPVAMFLWASIILQRDLYARMCKGAFALFSAGTITVFVAGLFKALWKLLLAMQICDFVALNKTFFPMQTTGFVLAGAGVAAMLCRKQGPGTMYSTGLPLAAAAAAVPVYESSMPFVILMVLGVAVLDVGLGILSAREKQPAAAVLYAVSFVFVMGMGYMSSRDFADPMMHWIAEAVNTAGQGCFLLAALRLHKGGLGEK